MIRAIILAILVIIGGILILQFDNWWPWAKNLFDDQASNAIEAWGTILQIAIPFGGFILFLVFRRSVFELIASKRQDQSNGKTELQQDKTLDFPAQYYKELFIQCIAWNCC